MEYLNGNNKAELVRADTALQSFRDGGYSFTDAIGEIVDNALQAGSRKIWFDWNFESIKKGKSEKAKREIISLAVADDGCGIPASILSNVLTIGFSTRYNNREGIGRFGVGFKLASISQAKRLEIYTRPTFVDVIQEEDADGILQIVNKTKNTEGRIFMSYLDLDEIKSGDQNSYSSLEVDNFPQDYKHLLENTKNGTLIIWRNIDRMNEDKAYTVSADEKIATLNYFLARTYRIYIDKGLKIFLPTKDNQLFKNEPLLPYDPTFQIENNVITSLGQSESMKGEYVEDGELTIDGKIVKWKVFLTPKVVRLVEGGGGIKGPKSDVQFKKLHIPDNQGKISFLRYDREISYIKVPHLIKGDSADRNGHLDRHIGIEVLFSPALDEYFQVRHIKRGVEPVEKLKKELITILNKPVKAARKRIREVWASNKAQTIELTPEDLSGGRDKAEETVKLSNTSMPMGKAGNYVSPQTEYERLLATAVDMGIEDIFKQKEFADQALQKPINALEMSWPGKGLLDIEHLNKTVIVKINKNHPFIREIYSPLKQVCDKDISDLDDIYINHLFEKAREGIDLLFFAYAKAENMSQNPEEQYMELREDWGKFTATYLKKRDEMSIG